MSDVWHRLDTQSYTDAEIVVSVALDMPLELAVMTMAIAESTAAVAGGIAFDEVMTAGGFEKDPAPDGLTIQDVAAANPDGTYAVVTASRITAVRGGQIHDAVDTSEYVPLYIWHKPGSTVNYGRGD